MKQKKGYRKCKYKDVKYITLMPTETHTHTACLHPNVHGDSCIMSAIGLTHMG